MTGPQEDQVARIAAALASRQVSDFFGGGFESGEILWLSEYLAARLPDSRVDIEAKAVIANIRALHVSDIRVRPPGPCVADGSAWPCDAEYAARLLEGHRPDSRVDSLMAEHPEWGADERAAAEALLGFVNPTTDPAEIERRRITWDAFEQGRDFERRFRPDSRVDIAEPGLRDALLESLLRTAAGTGEEATAAERILWADVERYIQRLIDSGLADPNLTLIAGNIRGFWGWWLDENRAALRENRP
jgi:hypothetical protein